MWFPLSPWEGGYLVTWMGPWVSMTGPGLWLRGAGAEPQDYCRFQSQAGGTNEYAFCQVPGYVCWTGPCPWLEKLELSIEPFKDLWRQRHECVLPGPVPAGLLWTVLGRGLDLSIGQFQDLQGCRWKYFPLGHQTLRTAGRLADCDCKEARASFRKFQDLGMQMGVSSVRPLCQQASS